MQPEGPVSAPVGQSIPESLASGRRRAPLHSPPVGGRCWAASAPFCLTRKATTLGRPAPCFWRVCALSLCVLQFFPFLLLAPFLPRVAPPAGGGRGRLLQASRLRPAGPLAPRPCPLPCSFPWGEVKASSCRLALTPAPPLPADTGHVSSPPTTARCPGGPWPLARPSGRPDAHGASLGLAAVPVGAAGRAPVDAARPRRPARGAAALSRAHREVCSSRVWRPPG